MMVAAVDTDADFRVGEVTELFDAPEMRSPMNIGLATYDVSPDGQRFVMVRQGEARAELTSVLDWFEDLKARVPTN